MLRVFHFDSCFHHFLCFGLYVIRLVNLYIFRTVPLHKFTDCCSFCLIWILAVFILHLFCVHYILPQKNLQATQHLAGFNGIFQLYPAISDAIHPSRSLPAPTHPASHPPTLSYSQEQTESSLPALSKCIPPAGEPRKNHDAKETRPPRVP